MSFSVICNSLEDTEKLAEKFAAAVLQKGAFVSMHGSMGAGKTAFTKAVCRYLNVKEEVSSPSFVILNEYKTGKIPVYHFDLYRLENDGVSSVINELEEYSEGEILTFVEWAEFSSGAVPFDRVELTINYIDENSREFIFKAMGEKSSKILKILKEAVK